MDLQKIPKAAPAKRKGSPIPQILPIQAIRLQKPI